MTTALQGGAQQHGHQPHRHSDPGNPGLTQVKPDPGQGGQGQEDGSEQEALRQVGRHGATPHGRGQTTQPRQIAALPGPTGVQGQQRQPTTGADQPRHLVKRHGPNDLGPARGSHRGPDAAQGPDPQTTQADDGQEAAVPLGMSDEVGVGQTSPKEHRRNRHCHQIRTRARGPDDDTVGDVGQERDGRAGLLLVGRCRRGRARGTHETAQDKGDDDAGDDDDGA